MQTFVLSLICGTFIGAHEAAGDAGGGYREHPGRDGDARTLCPRHARNSASRPVPQPTSITSPPECPDIAAATTTSSIAHA